MNYKNIKRIVIIIIFVLILGNVKTTFATPAGDNIIISEIEYDTVTPPGTDQKNEWFELYNPTPSVIDISGWTITDGEGFVTFPAATTLASNTYFIGNHTATGGKLTQYPAVVVDLEYGLIDVGSLNFANVGDELTLADGGGAIIDFVSWGGGSRFNISAIEGTTISRGTSTDTDLESDWLDDQVPSPGSGVLAIINTVPTDIKLDAGDADNFDENTLGGSLISVLTTVDVDVADTHTYTLVAGDGDQDNNKFQISGANLQSAFGIPLIFTPDFENPIDLGDTVGNNTYSIRLQTNDGNGGTYEESFIITINDLDENLPVITIIGNSSISMNLGDAYVDAGATANDDVDGDITASIITINPVDINTAGTYTITYNVDDSASNSAVEITRSVTVNEVVSSKRKGSKKISKSKLAEIFGKKVEEIKEDKKESKNLCEASTLLHQNMKAGDRNNKYSSWEKGNISEVKLLQSHMNRLGFDAGDVDGILGPITDGAIKRMQISLGFVSNLVDGYVGILTRERINNSC